MLGWAEEEKHNRKKNMGGEVREGGWERRVGEAKVETGQRPCTSTTLYIFISLHFYISLSYAIVTLFVCVHKLSIGYITAQRRRDACLYTCSPVGPNY